MITGDTGRIALRGNLQARTAMFDTIILLAGPAEHVAMPPLLRAHNLRLSVISVATSADLAAVDLDRLEWARRIAFVTPEIVSRSILEKLGYGAINLHPGNAAGRLARLGSAQRHAEIHRPERGRIAAPASAVGLLECERLFDPQAMRYRYALTASRRRLRLAQFQIPARAGAVRIGFVRKPALPKFFWDRLQRKWRQSKRAAQSLYCTP